MNCPQQRPPVILAAFLVAGLASTLGTLDASAEERIETVTRRDGRRVLTNLAVYRPESPESPAPPQDGIELGALADRISSQYGVDPALTRAIIEIESGFDPRAVSPRGARGLMQLMPDTGARFGVSRFFDPAENIEGGVRYLRFLLDEFPGALDLALAAYNAGENRVARLGRVPAIPETRDYVRKVRSAYARLGRPAAGLDGVATAEPARIYRSTDERGVVRFSNVGP